MYVPGPVTSLREHPRRAGRYLLEVAEILIGPISIEAIGELGLREGRVLDVAALARAVAASREVACYDKALDALARRSRSRQDLERWLRDRAFTAPEIAPALDRLAALGLLDDLAFARGFAHARAVGRGYGLRRVAAELARRGVARAVVDEVLSDLRAATGGDESDALTAAAERRFKSLSKGSLAPEVARRRLIGWLARRGFPPSEATRAARRLIP